jgi:hypothetical protein
MRQYLTHRENLAYVARHRRIRTWKGSLRQVVRGRAGLVAGVLAFVALSGSASQLASGTVTGNVLSSSAAGVPAGAKAGSGEFAPAAPLIDPAEQARQAEEEARAAWLRDHPTPVAGLSQAQMDNALRIVQEGQSLGLPPRAYVIAVATAMQESNLYNLANSRVAESYNYWHEGSGSDHDSVGLFQQRANSGWGKVQDLMNPHMAAAAFYRALVRIPGWESLALTRAAQRVQVSAYPNAYAKHEARAQAVVDALVAPAP